MIIYDMNMLAAEIPCRKPRLRHWLSRMLLIALALLIAIGIAIGVAIRQDAVPEVDWFLRPIPQHLVMIHYGRNKAYLPKLAMSPHAALPRATLPSSRHQHYVSVYLQTPQRAWSLIWLL
jgi:hypothetical protein